MDWLVELSQIMPPPALEARRGGTSPEDWVKLEQEMGIKYPADFKEYVNIWGKGYIGRFFYMFSPTSDTGASLLPRASTSASEAYALLKLHYPTQLIYPNYPENGSMLMGGRTDNGDYLGWVIDYDLPPEQWSVAIWGHEEDVRKLEGVSFGQFIVGVVKGDIRPEEFPKGLWRTVPLSYQP